MFGYIYVNEQELKLKEYTAYRSFYCGLCRNLHLRYGRTAQMMLNYDLTFLALLLTGLYEPQTEHEMHRCAPHPAHRHQMSSNAAVDYAADMCVLLSWQKLQDDWEDERRPVRRAAAARLHPAYRRLAETYPRQAKALEENIRALHEAEQNGLYDIDAVAGLTGQFLAEIFVWKEDVWAEDLRTMGFYLGKFIYLMDALEDQEKDAKRGNYNLFSQAGPVWGTAREKETEAILTDMMAGAARAFERLPVIEHAEIIRNILYSGVWCKYAALRVQAERKNETDRVRSRQGSRRTGQNVRSGKAGERPGRGQEKKRMGKPAGSDRAAEEDKIL